MQAAHVPYLIQGIRSILSFVKLCKPRKHVTNLNLLTGGKSRSLCCFLAYKLVEKLTCARFTAKMKGDKSYKLIRKPF